MPRKSTEIYGGGRRKFSDNVPIREPGVEDPSEMSRRTISVPPLFLNSDGPLVAIFTREEKASLFNSSPTLNAAKEATEEEVEEEEGSSFFEEHHSIIRSQITLCWVLRFPSKSTATAWLTEARLPPNVLPSTGKIWMLTEQGEVFWATGTSLEKLSWNKVCINSIVISIFFSWKVILPELKVYQYLPKSEIK